MFIYVHTVTNLYAIPYATGATDVHMTTVIYFGNEMQKN